MDILNDIFLDNENNSLERMKRSLLNGDMTEILNELCFIKDNNIILNYIYFKYIGQEETYDYILSYITNNIDTILITNNEFIVHVNMKNFTISDIDKHKQFIQYMSGFLKNKYPEKLSKCYVYNSSFMFSQIFNIVSMFIDKDTQKKIILVK